VRKFDCVIGADGLHSNVRRVVFGEESRFLRDLGLYLCVYSVPNYLQLDRMGDSVLGTGPNCRALDLPR
jgi:2-polyprenyl-6-methoxyphenol hydroxylase-like FAD-dependent oxidoreductase